MDNLKAEIENLKCDIVQRDLLISELRENKDLLKKMIMGMEKELELRRTNMDQALKVMERVETLGEVKEANNKLILETTQGRRLFS